MEIMAASEQWRSRPADERFISLDDMQSALDTARGYSSARCVSSRALTVRPIAEDSKGLAIEGPNGAAVFPTHWAFGQLAQRAGAPVGYLRDLPAPLAADCVNYGLVHRDIEDLGVLLYKNGGAPELRAVTGPNYGRIWNADIVRALRRRFGDGLTGAFRVPGEFGKVVEVTKENTTLYASDRDMFVFLADEQNRITVPNRRDGKSGDMARGFFVWNSETGKTSLGIATFLFDYVCCNRIIWGADGYQEIRVRHSSGAPDRWVEEVAPAIERYAASSTAGIVKSIADAKAARIDDVSAFLAARFTQSQARAIEFAHVTDEGRPIESLWDAATGVTAYARGLQNQDDRVLIEREAGKILKLAA
ncbi:MAG: DUF932 domain-containing protein [Acidiferrobacteraceae bacterium]